MNPYYGVLLRKICSNIFCKWLLNTCLIAFLLVYSSPRIITSNLCIDSKVPGCRKVVLWYAGAQQFYFVLFFQIAALLTTPFDVVKTHRQMELGELVFSKLKVYMCIVATYSINEHFAVPKMIIINVRKGYYILSFLSKSQHLLKRFWYL